MDEEKKNEVKETFATINHRDTGITPRHRDKLLLNEDALPSDGTGYNL